jgi:hypothetical protein
MLLALTPYTMEGGSNVQETVGHSETIMPPPLHVARVEISIMLAGRVAGGSIGMIIPRQQWTTDMHLTIHLESNVAQP